MMASIADGLAEFGSRLHSRSRRALTLPASEAALVSAYGAKLGGRGGGERSGVVEGGDAGKHQALQQLERGAAACTRASDVRNGGGGGEGAEGAGVRRSGEERKPKEPATASSTPPFPHEQRKGPLGGGRVGRCAIQGRSGVAAARKECSAGTGLTGGDVGHLLGEASLLDGGDGVSASNDGDGALRAAGRGRGGEVEGVTTLSAVCGDR
jgi:hypothetical protein